MTVYFVTGKLGAGKSLSSVGRIKDALIRGVPVATNLDLNLRALIGRKSKMCRVMRVPDKPGIQDLRAIGNGNKTYDESKNGLLVLDECGTWFNSRTWNDKSRQEVINWCLHARKLGWDIIFIVQDISIVDKQARLALGEHVVFCRRLDRIQIPIISSLISTVSLGLIKLKFPKLHVGIVKYGDNPQTSLTVDKWLLWGTDLYYAYDTKQAFSDHYDKGVFTLLPPYYTHYRYNVPYTVRNIMRITKIYGKKYSRPFVFTLGVVITFIGMTLTQPKSDSYIKTVISSSKKISDLKLSEYSINRFTNFPNEPIRFELINKSHETITSDKLLSDGFEFKINSKCDIDVIQGNNHEKVNC